MIAWRGATLAITAAVSGFGAPAWAQDDGPRVYQLAPVGAQNLTAFLVNKRGNEAAELGSVSPGSDIDTDILVFRYARTIELAGRSVTPFLILPTGRGAGERRAVQLRLRRYAGGRNDRAGRRACSVT